MKIVHHKESDISSYFIYVIGGGFTGKTLFINNARFFHATLPNGVGCEKKTLTFDKFKFSKKITPEVDFFEYTDEGIQSIEKHINFNRRDIKTVLLVNLARQDAAESLARLLKLKTRYQLRSHDYAFVFTNADTHLHKFADVVQKARFQIKIAYGNERSFFKRCFVASCHPFMVNSQSVFEYLFTGRNHNKNYSVDGLANFYRKNLKRTLKMLKIAHKYSNEMNEEIANSKNENAKTKEMKKKAKSLHLETSKNKNMLTSLLSCFVNIKAQNWSVHTDNSVTVRYAKTKTLKRYNASQFNRSANDFDEFYAKVNRDLFKAYLMMHFNCLEKIIPISSEHTYKTFIEHLRKKDHHNVNFIFALESESKKKRRWFGKSSGTADVVQESATQKNNLLDILSTLGIVRNQSKTEELVDLQQSSTNSDNLPSVSHTAYTLDLVFFIINARLMKIIYTEEDEAPFEEVFVEHIKFLKAEQYENNSLHGIIQCNVDDIVKDGKFTVESTIDQVSDLISYGRDNVQFSKVIYRLPYIDIYLNTRTRLMNRFKQKLYEAVMERESEFYRIVNSNFEAKRLQRYISKILSNNDKMARYIPLFMNTGHTQHLQWFQEIYYRILKRVSGPHSVCPAVKKESCLFNMGAIRSLTGFFNTVKLYNMMADPVQFNTIYKKLKYLSDPRSNRFVHFNNNEPTLVQKKNQEYYMNFGHNSATFRRYSVDTYDFKHKKDVEFANARFVIYVYTDGEQSIEQEVHCRLPKYISVKYVSLMNSSKDLPNHTFRQLYDDDCILPNVIVLHLFDLSQLYKMYFTIDEDFFKASEQTVKERFDQFVKDVNHHLKLLFMCELYLDSDKTYQSFINFYYQKEYQPMFTSTTFLRNFMHHFDFLSETDENFVKLLSRIVFKRDFFSNYKLMSQHSDTFGYPCVASLADYDKSERKPFFKLLKNGCIDVKHTEKLRNALENSKHFEHVSKDDSRISIVSGLSHTDSKKLNRHEVDEKLKSQGKSRLKSDLKHSIKDWFKRALLKFQQQFYSRSAWYQKHVKHYTPHVGDSGPMFEGSMRICLVHDCHQSIKIEHVLSALFFGNFSDLLALNVDLYKLNEASGCLSVIFRVRNDLCKKYFLVQMDIVDYVRLQKNLKVRYDAFVLSVDIYQPASFASASFAINMLSLINPVNNFFALYFRGDHDRFSMLNFVSFDRSQAKILHLNREFLKNTNTRDFISYAIPVILGEPFTQNLAVDNFLNLRREFTDFLIKAFRISGLTIRLEDNSDPRCSADNYFKSFSTLPKLTLNNVTSIINEKTFSPIHYSKIAACNAKHTPETKI